MNSSELKFNVEQNDPGTLFFSRNNMKFGGDTMRNYGVCTAKIMTANGEVEAWELYRRRPTRKGLTGSVFFCKKTFQRVRKV